MAEATKGVGSPGDVPRMSLPGSAGSLGGDVAISDRGVHSQKSYTCEVIDLTLARANELYDIAGSFVWSPDSSAATSLLQIRLDEVTNDLIPFQAGVRISGIPFKRLWLTNAAQVGDTITLMVSSDSPGDRIDTDA